MESSHFCICENQRTYQRKTIEKTTVIRGILNPSRINTMQIFVEEVKVYFTNCQKKNQSLTRCGVEKESKEIHISYFSMPCVVRYFESNLTLPRWTIKLILESQGRASNQLTRIKHREARNLDREDRGGIGRTTIWGDFYVSG